MKAKYRGLHIKYPEQLDWLKHLYPDKIDQLQNRLDGILAGHEAGTEEEILFLQTKIARLTDKFETTSKEIEGRELGHFIRDPHGTLYYLDLDAGDDAKDGLTIGNAWKTLAKYTTTTVRTAGDIAKVRANTDELMAADLVFDEDGDQDDYIEIRGCSIADDPWEDGSDVKPILTFGDNNNNAFPNGDNYWKLNRIIIKESADSFGNIRIRDSFGWYLLDSEFTDNSNASGSGVRLERGGRTTLENCILKDNLLSNLRAENAIAKLINCTLDGGATTTDYGIFGLYDSLIECIDTDFGQTTAHDVEDVYVTSGAIVKLRNCNLENITPSIAGLGAIVYEEDADAVYGAYKETYYHGINTKDTSIKTGLATFSMKMEPNVYCGLNNPLMLNDDSRIDYPFNILCTAGEEKTLTIKIRSLGTWGTYPTNSELYIEFNYLSNASTAVRTAIASTQVLSHASNWVEFTVTFTPLQTGIAYGAIYLKKYEDAGDGCYVNMELIGETKGRIIGAKPVIMGVVTPAYVGQDLTGDLEESVDLTGELES